MSNALQGQLLIVNELLGKLNVAELNALENLLNNGYAEDVREMVEARLEGAYEKI